MGTPKHARDTDASVVFRRLADGAALRPFDAPENGAHPEPDAVLATLLDLNGTVRIADHLAVRRNTLGGAKRRVAVPSPIRASLAKKVDEILDEARSTFDSPWTGRRALPGPELVRRVLEETGALATRDEAAITQAVTMWLSQARERFEHQLARARQRIRWLRTDVSNELRALSPAAAELEGFDAVLTRSLDPGFVRLLQQVEARLDQVFASRAKAAIRALPEADPSTDAWFLPGGFMYRHARDLASLLALLVDHEVDVLHSLADAAWALRNEEATV